MLDSIREYERRRYVSLKTTIILERKVIPAALVGIKEKERKDYIDKKHEMQDAHYRPKKTRRRLELDSEFIKELMSWCNYGQ